MSFLGTLWRRNSTHWRVLTDTFHCRWHHPLLQHWLAPHPQGISWVQVHLVTPSCTSPPQGPLSLPPHHSHWAYTCSPQPEDSWALQVGVVHYTIIDFWVQSTHDHDDCVRYWLIEAYGLGQPIPDKVFMVMSRLNWKVYYCFITLLGVFLHKDGLIHYYCFSSHRLGKSSVAENKNSKYTAKCRLWCTDSEVQSSKCSLGQSKMSKKKTIKVLII